MFRSCLSLLSLPLLVGVLSGCGLALDLSDPEPDGSIGRFDARVRDAGLVACTSDAQCASPNECEEDGQCLRGWCAAGNPIRCEDGIPCTDDRCVPGVGCESIPNDGLCGDAPPGDCRVARCVEGIGCLPLANDELCQRPGLCAVDSCDPDDGTCDLSEDDEICVRLVGNGSTCEDDGECSGILCGSPGDCPHRDCNDDDPPNCVGGVCEYTPSDEGAPCNDGNACTPESTTFCAGGLCLGTLEDCDDGEPCTFDYCESSGATPGCRNEDLSGDQACDDGLACTGPGTCASGTCQPGLLVCFDDPGMCLTRMCQSDRCVQTSTCGLNQNCVGGTCRCNVGLLDCDSNGSCECPTSSFQCNGTTCEPTPILDAGVNLDSGPPAVCLPGFVDCDGIPGCECNATGENRRCGAFGSGCICEMNREDCDLDGTCECDLTMNVCASTGVAGGTRICSPALGCSVLCRVDQFCCPCTGVCCTPGDGDCCLGCVMAPGP